jgi:hypothetical protein
MINWFKQKVIQWVREDWNKVRHGDGDVFQGQSSKTTSIISSGRRLDQSNGMNFAIHSANGGYVMEYNSYDPRTDERQVSLHIITSDQDLGQGIAHIITLEMLRK